jgi:hypothetical protein
MKERISDIILSFFYLVPIWCHPFFGRCYKDLYSMQNNTQIATLGCPAFDLRMPTINNAVISVDKVQ